MLRLIIAAQGAENITESFAGLPRPWAVGMCGQCLQSPAVRLDGLLVGVIVAGDMSREQQVRHRSFGRIAVAVMVGKQKDRGAIAPRRSVQYRPVTTDLYEVVFSITTILGPHLRQIVAVAQFQILTNPAVQLAPSGVEQALVDHFLHQAVAEETHPLGYLALSAGEFLGVEVGEMAKNSRLRIRLY